MESLPRRPSHSANDHIVNIPLSTVNSHCSSRTTGGSRREGQTMDSEYTHPPGENDGIFHGHIGRRRIVQDSSSTIGEDEGALTTMGKIYGKVMGFSIVSRYLFYILPLSLVLLVPILVSSYGVEDSTIGGVRMLWLFVWLEIVWSSLWISKLFAKALPTIFQTLVGVISSGVKKYSIVIRALEVPISLVGWGIASLCSFLPLMTRNRDMPPERFGVAQNWQSRFNKVLISFVVASLIYLGQKLLIQVVSVDYHRRQFAQRIKDNKGDVRFLSQLYEASRRLFPDYTEFREEDYIIHQTLNIPGMKGQNGVNTPMRNILENVQAARGKVTSVFGGLANEVAGNKKGVSSSYNITVSALHKKRGAEALATRIWMSFVPEGSTALTLEDLKEVMGEELEAQAEDCFHSLDRDDNGDVSLEEMILHTTFLHSERRDVAKNVADVGSAISALNNVLGFIAFMLIVIVFVVAQQSSVGTTVAGAGTMLISLSFVFALTAQEILASCIFLFVKHPYDVGDRVDIDGKKYIVEKISLLYSNFMRVDNHKATQMPHNILNGLKSIENITRSRFLQEQIMVGVHYETSVNDIQRLKQELMAFTSENSRDFQPELEVEVCDINNLDRLVLRIDICHRGNWANESVTLARRNKFMCALVGILKSIPIIAPLSGDPPVGEINRPMYTVAVSDGHAKDNIQKARAAKTARRWDYAPEEETDVDSHETMHKGPEITYSGSDAASITGTTAAGTTPFEAKADRLFAEDTRTLRRVTSNSSSMAISEMRGGVIVRGETKGRRRKAVQGDGPAVPPPGQASAPEQQVPRPVSQAPQPASQTASQQQLAATVLPAAALLPAEVLPPAGYPYV